LNTEPLSSWDGAFKGSTPSLIPLNTEHLGRAAILVKTDGHLFEVDGYNLSNTEVLMLGGSSSSSLPSISSVDMC